MGHPLSSWGRKVRVSNIVCGAFAAFAVMFCIVGPAAAIPAPGNGQSSQSGTEIKPEDLAGDLLQVVFSRKANADVKDYKRYLVRKYR